MHAGRRACLVGTSCARQGYPGRVLEERPGTGLDDTLRTARTGQNGQLWLVLIFTWVKHRGFGTSVPNLTMIWRRPTADDCLKTGKTGLLASLALSLVYILLTQPYGRRSFPRLNISYTEARGEAAGRSIT